MSTSLSGPISVCYVCSVVSFCSVKSVSVNKSSSSLKKSSPKDPNKSKLGHPPVRPVQPLLLLHPPVFRSVLNRLNKDTTVYYCLVFCAFSYLIW